jgi:predicted phage-related endonuclease
MNALLDNLGLSKDAIAARKSTIGGSDANTIMSGNADRLIRLWREKRGEVEGEDLSDVLAVQMGSFTEPFNIAWFEKQTGRKVILPSAMAGGGIRRDKPEPFMSCTLDGWVAEQGDLPEAVFEAKHTGTRSTDAEVFARYVPQLTHNCLCTGAQGAFLSVFKGNGDWVMFEYDVDPGYAAHLVQAERDFWEHVRTGTPPAPLPPIATPRPKGVIEYDMTGSNEWAASAADYLETVLAADRHEIAKKTLKSLVPDDASKCAGHGIAIARDKRGALRFGKGE